MSKKSSNDALNHELVGAEANLTAVFLRYLSALYSVSIKDSEAYRFIKVQQRSEGDWVAILGIYGEDGTPLVAFGNGATFVAALTGVNATVQRGDWRVDKYP